MCNRRSIPRLLLGTILLAVGLCDRVLSDDSANLQVPKGFVVTQYADDQLAHDIFSLTFDAFGRVVVSGPGYVRILIDANHDGVAESYKQFADGPASGAQGMCFRGRDLICTGDAGLIRYRDANADDRADGRPDVFLKLKTGGEHHAHAVQRGPDGWWYVILGNDAGISSSYIKLKSSPIKEPHAGCILRLRPDLSGGEVIADGLRNSYDFAINETGDLFVFDSDSEREVSLPWYRPIRVLHTLPGSHAGWVSQNWIRPDHYLDMPGVVASFGRGSPTGVVCYQHTQFPRHYRGALFVLDWTFGRVLAVPLKKFGGSWTSTPYAFLSPKGDFGFAPTDAEVGPDGSLYISVGGRGTRGGVFKVTYVGDHPTTPTVLLTSGEVNTTGAELKTTSSELKTTGAELKMTGEAGAIHPKIADDPDGNKSASKISAGQRPVGVAPSNALTKQAQAGDRKVATDPKTAPAPSRRLALNLTPARRQDPLTSCLTALQPQSAWSRNNWVPAAKKLGRDAFVVACLDPLRPVAQRIRAIEIVTELFAGLDANTLDTLASDQSPAVRASAIWSAGRSPKSYTAASFKPFIEDHDASVARGALEALWTAPAVESYESLLPAIVGRLGDSDRAVRFAAARLIGRLDDAQATAISLTLDQSNPAAELWFTFGRCERTTQLNLSALERAIKVFGKTESPTLRLEAVRVMQIALGDCGPGRAVAGMFDGYTSPLDLKPHERELDALRIRVAQLFPTRNADVDFELARVIAMLQPLNAPLLDRVLDEISEKSNPVRDIHYLCVAASIPVDRTSEQCQRIAQALIELEPKIADRKLNQDRNWDDRVGEMYKQLVALDSDLPAQIVAQKHFGRPGHVLFLSEISPELLKPATDAFVHNIQADPHFKWTNGVVFLLGDSTVPAHRALIRNKYGDYPLRGAIVMALAQKPQEADRPKFIEGLESAQLEVVDACLAALQKLPVRRSAAEHIALVNAFRRLGNDKPELILRERAAGLLKRSTNEDFGFVGGEAGRRPQPQVLERWSGWLEQTYPKEFARMNALGGDDSSQARQTLAEVDWNTGDPTRGKKLFESRTCAQCHNGRTALGPDLSGVARRFSRDDLFTAIIQPSRDVSPRYQTTMIETRHGQVYTGMIVYEAVDEVLLRNASNQTFRFTPAEIEERRTLKTSLMPSGLLKDLKPADFADLYAYLRTLSAEASNNSRSAKVD
jgi:putative membrane-bound dehydrogenase-like protein